MNDQLKPAVTADEAHILVVDDQATTRTFHKAILDKRYAVETATSGDEALSLCMERQPDLVLLDVSMPGINGFDTCRRLLAHFDLPIIFVTAHDELEEHLKAYDAGGTDIIVKPVSAEILLRKAALAIDLHREYQRLHAEKTSLHNAAVESLQAIGESGVLLDFTRAALACRNYEALGQLFIDAARRLGADACVALRHDEGCVMLSAHGELTGLERSVLEQARAMGPMFQFQRRLALNFDRMSVVVSNMPEDVAQAERMRNNMTILCETTEALSENVAMRRESAARADQMQVALGQALVSMDQVRGEYQRMVAKVRLTLHMLSEDVESTYAWLATDRSTEAKIANTLHAHVESILSTLMNGASVDEELERIAAVLRGRDDGGDVELF